MKKIATVTLVLLLGMMSTSCSSLQNAGSRTFLNWENKPASVKCYSGGKLIYETVTEGKVTDDPGSDGFFFKDKDGKFIEINADCIFSY